MGLRYMLVYASGVEDVEIVVCLDLDVDTDTLAKVSFR